MKRLKVLIVIAVIVPLTCLPALGQMDEFGLHKSTLFTVGISPQEAQYFLTPNEFGLRGPVKSCSIQHSYPPGVEYYPTVWTNQDISSIDDLCNVEFDLSGRITRMEQKARSINGYPYINRKVQEYHYGSGLLDSCAVKFYEWNRPVIMRDYRVVFSYDENGQTTGFKASGKKWATTIVAIDRTNPSCPIYTETILTEKGKINTKYSISANRTISSDSVLTIELRYVSYEKGTNKQYHLDQKEVVTFSKEGEMLSQKHYQLDQVDQRYIYANQGNGITKFMWDIVNSYSQEHGMTYITYNEYGDVIKTDQRMPTLLVTECEYEYDSYGNWISKLVKANGKLTASFMRSIEYY